MPDQEVLDGRPLRVTEMQRAGDVRRWLDDRERGQGRIRRGSGAVRREDVGREPPLVDRAFDIAWGVCLGQIRHQTVAAPENHDARLSSGRAGRGTTCWFGYRWPSALITPGDVRC